VVFNLERTQCRVANKTRKRAPFSPWIHYSTVDQDWFAVA